jgi:hypothetical protein
MVDHVGRAQLVKSLDVARAVAEIIQRANDRLVVSDVHPKRAPANASRDRPQVSPAIRRA